MPLFGPKPMPLEVPGISTIPLPNVRVLQRSMEDTQFFLRVAREYAQKGEFDEMLPEILSIIRQASGTEAGRVEELLDLVAKGAALGLGLAKAEMNSTSLRAGPGLTHPIVHNAVCFSTQALPKDVAEGEAGVLVHFAVRVGYYIGKRGDPALLMVGPEDTPTDGPLAIRERLSLVEAQLAEARKDPGRLDETIELQALRDHLRSQLDE